MGDLRIPTGFFFALIGAILLIYSVIQPNARAQLSDVNVNLWSGLTMFVFGGVLLWLGRRAS